jgi:hypothetical protein
MRESTADAQLLREYALARKITVRAAQLHRKEGRPEWTAFRDEIRKRDLETADAPAAEREEKQALTRYEQINGILEGAIARREGARMTALLKAAETAHKVLTSVRHNHLEIKRASGRLVDLPAVAEMIHGNLGTLRTRLEELPEVIGTRITDSELDVAGIVRSEVESIFRELEAAASGIPYRPSREQIAQAIREDRDSR